MSDLAQIVEQVARDTISSIFHLCLEVPGAEQVRGDAGAVVPSAFVRAELEVGEGHPVDFLCD